MDTSLLPTTSAVHSAASEPVRPPPDQRARVLWLSVLMVVAGTVTALAAFSNPPADLWLWRAVERLELSGASAWASPTIIWTAAIAVAVAAGLIGWSCRTMRIFVPAAVLSSLGLGWALGQLI